MQRFKNCRDRRIESCDPSGEAAQVLGWAMSIVLMLGSGCNQQESPGPVRLSPAPARTPKVDRTLLLPDRTDGWTLAEEGPELGEDLANALGLDESSIAQMNEALQATYREYLEMEEKYTEVSTAEGYRTTDIKPLENADMAKLEDALWSRLDPLLDVGQQTKARAQLRVFATPGREGVREQDSIWEAVKPGLLGWGRAGCRVSIRKVGMWYDWFVSKGPTFGAVWIGEGGPGSGMVYPHNHAGRGPELPLELARFAEPAGGAEEEDEPAPKTEAES